VNLTEEEEELICNHIIPWFSNNNITLSNNGTFHSESTIPPLVPQCLIRHGAVPAAAHQAPSPHTQPTTTTVSSPIEIPATAMTEEGPTQADHPVFSPEQNVWMPADGIRIVEGKICAPNGVNKHLKRVWEILIAKGKPYQPPDNTTLSTSSKDSDSSDSTRPNTPGRSQPSPVRKQSTRSQMATMRSPHPGAS